MAMDVSAISKNIDSMVKVYRESLTKSLYTIKAKRATLQAINTTFSSLLSQLNSLKSSTAKLRDSTVAGSIFHAKSATSSDTDTVTASASNESAPGVHNISITQLAKNFTQVSADYSSDDTNIRSNVGTGTKEFKIMISCLYEGAWQSKTANISVEIGESDTNDDILARIADAINDASVTIDDTTVHPVNATVVHQTEGMSRLVIQSKETGNKATVLIEDVTGTLASYTGIENALTTENTTYGSAGTDIAGTLKAGTFKFSISINGITRTIEVVIDSDTEHNWSVLKKMQDAINASDVGTASDGVTASGIPETEPSPAEDVTLTIAAKTGGDLFSVMDITTGALAATTSLKTTQAKSDSGAGYIYKDSELNSVFTVNTLSMERTSNTVSDAVTGVTFSLLKESSATVQVDNDIEAVKGEVESFLNTYNEALDYLYEKTGVTKVDDEFQRGPLSRYFRYRNLPGELRRIMMEKVEGALINPDYDTLYEIGITADSEGHLSISDTAKFENILKADSTNISNLFNLDDEDPSKQGKAVRIYEKIKEYVEAGGFIDSSQDATTDRVDYLTERIKRMEQRIEKRVENYRERLGYLQGQLAYYSGQYAIIGMYYGTSDISI